MENDESKKDDEMMGEDGDELEASKQPEVTNEPAASTTEPAPAQPKASSGGGKAVWVVLVVLALLIGGGIGYAMGMNGDDDAEVQALQEQVTDLENQLNTAKEGAGNTALEAKNQEISELETENAALEQENAELKEQLDDSPDDGADANESEDQTN